jgi:hypothetical protein
LAPFDSLSFAQGRSGQAYAIKAQCRRKNREGHDLAWSGFLLSRFARASELKTGSAQDDKGPRDERRAAWMENQNPHSSFANCAKEEWGTRLLAYY